MEGILVPITIFLVLGAMVIAPRYFKSRERESLQATLRAAIERGQPLPPDVIEAITRDVKPARETTPGSDLRRGIIWLGVAAGMVGFAYAVGYGVDDSGDWFWPLIGIAAFPGFIGGALLVIAMMNRSKTKI